MTIATSSVVTAMPKQFRGLRVLLIESDKDSLQDHAFILSQNFYRVRSTLGLASALSMLLNGDRFECALVDADKFKMGLMEFINHILKRRPRLSFVMIASTDVHMRNAKDTMENEAILCLYKPCAYSDISNIWQHVCRNRTALQENYSNGELPKENQTLHIDDRVDPMINLSAIPSNTMVDNNISCMVTHKPGTNTSVQAQNQDKGKQKLVIESENHQPNEKDKSRKKRKVPQRRLTWTDELHAKFLKALQALRGQKVYPSAILKLMNVPGLKRENVMSHLQNYRERENVIQIANKDTRMQRGNNLNIERCAWKRSTWQPTPSNNDASIINLSNPLKPATNLNTYGISYMTIDNIKARLQEAPPLPTSLVTTSMNNFDGVKGTDHINFGNPQQSLIGETFTSTTFGLVGNSPIGGKQNTEAHLTSYGYGNGMEQLVTGDDSSNHDFGGTLMALSGVGTTVASGQNLVTSVNNFSNGFDNGNSVGVVHSGVSEIPEPLDGFGVVTEASLAGGGFTASSSNHHYEYSMEKMVTCENSSYPLFGEAIAPLGVGAKNVSDVLGKGNYECAGGSGVSNAPTPLDCFGIVTEASLAGGGGTAFSSDYGYGKEIDQVFAGGNSSNQTFEETMAPSGVAVTVHPDYNLAMNASNFSNNFGNGNSEGEVLAPFDGLGIETEPWVVAAGGGGGGTHGSSDNGVEDLAFSEFLSYDLENLCQFDDFQGNREILLPDLPPSMTLSDTDMFFNPIDSNFNSTPGEENNNQAQILPPVSSIVPLDGSDGGFVDGDSFLELFPDLQMIDPDLVNGPW